MHWKQKQGWVFSVKKLIRYPVLLRWGRASASLASLCVQCKGRQHAQAGLKVFACTCVCMSDLVDIAPKCKVSLYCQTSCCQIHNTGTLSESTTLFTVCFGVYTMCTVCLCVCKGFIRFYLTMMRYWGFL